MNSRIMTPYMRVFSSTMIATRLSTRSMFDYFQVDHFPEHVKPSHKNQTETRGPSSTSLLAVVQNSYNGKDKRINETKSERWMMWRPIRRCRKQHLSTSHSLLLLGTTLLPKWVFFIISAYTEVCC